MEKTEKKQTPKAEKKQKTKRRTHSSFDELPVALRGSVVGMIMSDIWPLDFKGKTKGKPRYMDVINYCRQKGFTVSMSATGRFSAQLCRFSRAKKEQEIQATPLDFKKRVESYLFEHFVLTARHFIDNADRLYECKFMPTDVVKENLSIEEKEQLAESCINGLVYMRELLEAIFELPGKKVS